MIIDFHTHIFPDKIVEKTISYLANKADIAPKSNGTIDGLLGEMQKADVDISITLPVLTSPTQFDSILSYTEKVNQEFNGKIISFMGMHPDILDKEEKIRLIKEKGFKGIKIHPDYQDVYFDDERYIEILLLAKKYNLIVVTHAGVDYGFRDRPVKCTPDRVLKVLDKVGDMKLVLAHFGGYELTDEVYLKLAGKNVYFDTSFVLSETDKDTFVKMLDKHGADKILFATDSPWSSAFFDVQKIKSFGLDKDVEDKILFQNATKLLGL